MLSKHRYLVALYSLTVLYTCTTSIGTWASRSLSIFPSRPQYSGESRRGTLYTMGTFTPWPGPEGLLH